MAKDLFTREDKNAIENAIRSAELNTSGEVQVHIESHCKGNVLDRAARVFSILKMHKTSLRNGVLFYLAVKDHKFAILGDVGINQLTPDDFWDDIKVKMGEYFKNEEITAGICEGIRMAGEQLKSHFPYQNDDINELPDEVSFGE
jgi:uncharacterized membrane protein